MPKSVERREAVIKEMELEKCSYRFFDGITGPVAKTNISRAHKSVIQYAKDSGMEAVCVAEDDLQFTGTGAWKYFLDNIPEEYDIYLSSYYPDGKHDENFVVSNFRGMTLFLCHSRFYDKFLSLPEHMHVDGAISLSGALVKVCPLFVTRQAPGYSDQRKRFAENNIVGKQMFGQ